MPYATGDGCYADKVYDRVADPFEGGRARGPSNSRSSRSARGFARLCARSGSRSRMAVRKRSSRRCMRICTDGDVTPQQKRAQTAPRTSRGCVATAYAPGDHPCSHRTRVFAKNTAALAVKTGGAHRRAPVIAQYPRHITTVCPTPTGGEESGLELSHGRHTKRRTWRACH